MQISRVAVVWDSGYSGYNSTLSSIETEAKAMAIELIPVPVRSPAEVAQAIPAFAAQPNGGLLVMPMRGVLSIPIYKLAVEYKLPSIGSGREEAANGALLSYGSKENGNDLFRDAATYVDRILGGAKLGDLPVQFPTKFEMVLNLKTAKALGLTIPETLLATADEIIQ